MPSIKMWRSFEELAQTDEFRKFVDDEFPNRTPDWNDHASRRKFLTLMGASVALAGASACTVQPPEAIVPWTTSLGASILTPTPMTGAVGALTL